MTMKKIINKRKVILTIAVVLLITIAIYSVIRYNKKLKEEEFLFESLEWEDKKEVCGLCLEDDSECNRRIRLTAIAPNIAERLSRNNVDALHCLLIVDGIDQFREKGSYFNMKKEAFVTWHNEDIRKDHEITYCCGAGDITWYNEKFKSNFKFYQVCHTKTVDALCD